MQNTQSISQLGELIKNTLENELEPTYWVIGEIADFRQAPQGHAYFELVEKQGNQVLAKIRCNCWQFTFRSIASRFETLTGAGLKNGMKVLAQVQVTFHSVYGLSLNVKDIDPSFSLGERARIRQETIDRLTKEGLLRLNAGRVFPQVIQKIAIISSPTAAGYGDFINQLENNAEGYKVYHKLFPSLMQGNEAVSSLIQAIELAESKKESLELEALIIIRGGGAQLDLDCFDDYRLAAKIAQCSLPVFTGIGHERDETVADLVAHTRLKTPTAVAEFLLSGFRIFEETLALGLNRLDRSTSQFLKLEESKLLQISHGLKSSSLSQVLLEKEKVKAKQVRLELASKRQIMGQTESLEQLEKALKKETLLLLTQENQKLGNLEKLLNQLNPESIMKRGYSRSEINGIPVQFADPKIGDEMLTFSQDQKIKSTITKIEKP
ncbi:exodeoxyribonuclease VII large subunit [Algoriphagus sp. CAU 1675]|uniref:exodeoxyribonuclease VII large subunit n=1 Tax=Algoriphagus sp. CAU 1675 TaxID=3032597 RepID=UPI0023DBC9D6|nr:exodeoxyribonuclease VII large subunit [Algoriphagus sp. CAU 1675]MDF2158515.1 exodeoxyribonuclease VII large subunit [Algoriphagus sp. CAU 1675]